MEIVTTERHYVQELNSIVSEFLVPLKVDPSSSQFLASTQLEAIFVNVATLETLAKVGRVGLNLCCCMLCHPSPCLVTLGHSLSLFVTLVTLCHPWSPGLRHPLPQSLLCDFETFVHSLQACTITEAGTAVTVYYSTAPAELTLPGKQVDGQRSVTACPWRQAIVVALLCVAVLVLCAHAMVAGVLLQHMSYFREHEAFCKHQAASPIDLTKIRASNPALHSWLTKHEVRVGGWGGSRGRMIGAFRGNPQLCFDAAAPLFS